MRRTLAGIAAGSLAVAGLVRLMRKTLFEVQPLDPVAFPAAAVIRGGFARLACYGQARPAAGVGPLLALRHDP